MRERLIELLLQYKEHPEKTCPEYGTNTPCEGCKYDLGDDCDRTGRFADHLLANGVIVPPVAVGDDVYYIKGGYYKKPQYCEVSRPCKVVEVSLKLQRNGNRVMRGFITDNGTRYSFDSIGKTVFLTREEAEKALAEREGKG
jgi:hypothetical protein